MSKVNSAVAVFVVVLTVALLVPGSAFGQAAPKVWSGSVDDGPSRVSGSATQSKEESPQMRTRLGRKGATTPTAPVRFQFMTQTYVYQRDLATNERPLSSAYNYVGASWRFKPSQYIAVRQPFSYFVPKYEGDASIELEDLYLNYWHANLREITKDTTLGGMIRLYLPTGEDSRFIDKRSGAIRGTLMTNTELKGRWDMNYTVYLQLNNNTQDTYKLEDRRWAAIDRSFVQGATFNYAFNEKFSASQLAGTTSNWAETGDRYSENEHFFNAVSTLYYQINDGVSASLALHNDIEVGDDLRPFRFLMDEDITYIFSIAATL